MDEAFISVILKKREQGGMTYERIYKTVFLIGIQGRPIRYCATLALFCWVLCYLYYLLSSSAHGVTLDVKHVPIASGYGTARFYDPGV